MNIPAQTSGDLQLGFCLLLRADAALLMKLLNDLSCVQKGCFCLIGRFKKRVKDSLFILYWSYRRYFFSVLCINVRLQEKSGYLAVIREAAPCVRCTCRRHVRTSSFSSLQEVQRGSISLARAECFWACSPSPEVTKNIHCGDHHYHTELGYQFGEAEMRRDETLCVKRSNCV